MSTRILLPTLLMVCALAGRAPGQTVVISEFLAINDSFNTDEDGSYEDWIELYNYGGSPVALDGYYLTDNPTNLDKWRIPAVTINPGAFLVVWASNKNRAVPGSPLHTNFKLSGTGEYLALVAPDEVTALSEFTPTYPAQQPNVSYGLTFGGSSGDGYRFFVSPTPGGSNNTSPADQGPTISEVSHSPAQPTDADKIDVRARVTALTAPVASVSLVYRVNYVQTVTISMVDDGLHSDGGANDGIFGASISAAASSPGDMVRYKITATDTGTHTSRLPVFASPLGSAEYFGTVIADPGTQSSLPILRWFVQSVSAADSLNGTQCSVHYLGRFYDNVYVRRRGNTSSGWAKKNHKFDFNSGDYFYFDLAKPPAEEFNLNSTYSDKSYVRQILSWETYVDAGCAGSLAWPIRVQQNNTFYSVAIYVEQPDEQMLERNDLDGDGALYKMYNQCNNATNFFEKKTRSWEGTEDLQALVAGVAPTNPNRAQYVFDNVDIPATINYIAATAIIHDNDHVAKNYYVYRDSDGSGEWTLLPWDKDLTFGRNYGAGGGVLSDGMWAANDPQSHPLFGDSDHPKIDGPWNRFIDAVLDTPATREMCMRRLRTLMDRELQPPGTPTAELRFEARIDQLSGLMAPDVAFDRARWGNPYGLDQDMATAVGILKNEYLTVRRTHLYNTHAAPGGIIPGVQPSAPVLAFGQMDRFPASGDQDEEFVQIINSNAYSVDISGWAVSGDVTHVFRPGTVIIAGGSIYISPDVAKFRGRATSPHGGQMLLVQGNYKGHLSEPCDEPLVLSDLGGRVVAQVCACGAPDSDLDADGTLDCFDGCPNDPLKTSPGTCGCGVADSAADADSDGTVDCLDGCPLDPLKTVAGACGCGVADLDSDGDGALNCNDGCPNDPSKTSPGACGCGVSDTDSDSDGVADCNDGCPNDPLKTSPGTCGCGVVDSAADADSDGTVDCLDGCPLDPLKTVAGVCGCGVADVDSDSDGTADCNDGCPNDPLKTSPGTCGCGVADSAADADSDGTVDCLDGCPLDPLKTVAGACGCGVADADSDSDGTADCNDGCPNDPLKTSPGTCGCGVADSAADADSDGTVDCLDGCPNDPLKTSAGTCGCGVADTDSDSDGTPNCNDGCPNDPLKTSPGTCGCGVVDSAADADSDGTVDCLDGCPLDPLKTVAGACGCGVADTDTDSDGTPNCNDGCPNDPLKTSPGECGCGVAEGSCGGGVADCASRVAVSAGLTPFSTSGSSVDGPETPCGGPASAFQSDTWFSYTPVSAGLVTVSVCDADFAARLAVYDGTGPTEQVCATLAERLLACADDGCGGGGGGGGGGPTLGFQASAGREYLLRVGGDAPGNQGTGTLSVSLTPAEPVRYLAVFGAATAVPGVGTVQNEDIVGYDTSTGQWSMYFDGSDVGLSSAAIDALALLPDGDLVFSVTTDLSVAGLTGGPSGTQVDDADLVRFTATSLGSTTAGVLSFYFDGSDVGLPGTDGNSDIDALGVDQSGRLLISTLGNNPALGAVSADEDVLMFTPTSLGQATAGSWTLRVDGSDVGLSQTADEDIDGLSAVNGGDLVLSTLGAFSVPGVSGTGSDLVRFTPTQTGATTAGSYGLFASLVSLGIPPTASLTAMDITPLARPDDECSGAAPVSAGLTVLDTAGATTSDVATECAGGSGVVYRDIWRTYTATQTSEVTFSVCDGVFAARLMVYSGTGCAGLEGRVLGCADEGCGGGGGGPAVTVTLAPGETCLIRIGGAAATASGAGTLEIEEVPPAHAVYDVSFTASTAVPGVGTATNEDIVEYDPLTGLWKRVFDGSDLGLGSLTIDAFAFLANGDLLLSFTTDTSVPGVTGGPDGTLVDDADIVRFTPTSLGEVTAGTLSFYFDGSDVNLDSAATGKDIDALAVEANGDLLISLVGTANVVTPQAQDEDVLRFHPTSLGAATAGTWSRLINGSGLGLSDTADEDIDGLAVLDAGIGGGGYAFSTVGAFSATGLSGVGNDVVGFTPTSLGTTTSGTLTLLQAITAAGIPPTAVVTGLDIRTIGGSTGLRGPGEPGGQTGMPTSHPACAADVNGDSTLDSQDLTDFLEAFFAGNADFNRSGATDSQDYFDFLNAFLNGCP